MARIGARNAHDNDTIGHGDRPWVYFMIDCFFLVTQFFVLTFHVKVDEMVLPQKMPPGVKHPIVCPPPGCNPSVTVHVNRDKSGVVTYEFMMQRLTLQELTDALARVKGQGTEPIVRVSYEAHVPFGDVMALFNACAKVRIENCGLIPLRSSVSRA